MNKTEKHSNLRVKLAKLSSECCLESSSSESKLIEIINKYNPKEVTDIIINEGLVGFLWASIYQSGYFPEQQLEELKKYRFDALKRELLIRQKIPALWRQFNQIGIDPILFRGLSYSKIYPANTFRDISDVDILIQQNDFEKLINALTNLGWQSYFNYPDLYWKDGVSIDIHTEMMGSDRKTGRSHAGEISTDELFQRSATVQIEGINIRILDPIDDLICASIHWLKHSFMRMCWGVDLCMLCHKIAENNLWDDAVKRIQNCNAFRLIKYGLLPVERIFSVSLPGALSAEKSGLLTNRFISNILDAVAQGEYADHCGYLLYASTFKNHFQKYKFIFDVIYPKSSNRKLLNNTIYSDNQNWAFPIQRIKRGLKGVSNLSRFYLNVR
ncbi:nucleotidyltransferase family protein [bacterium]|nr:nucleotidyltransferase family protein [bacterium]